MTRFALSQWLSKSTLLRQIVSGSAIVLIGDLATRLISFAIKLNIAAVLGVRQLGEYTTIVTSLALLGSFLGFGLDTWILREGGRDASQLSKNLKSVLALKFAAGLISAVIILIASAQVTLSTAFIAGCFAIMTDSLISTAFAVLRAIRRYALAALSQVFQPVVLLLLLRAIEPGAITSTMLLGAQAAISLFVIAVLFYATRKQVWINSNALSPLPVLASATSFVFADILASVYIRSSTLMLGLTTGQEAVGLFAPALDLMTTLYIVPSVVFGIALPILSNPDTSSDEFTRTITWLCGGAALYGAAAWIAINFGADIVFSQLYAEVYQPSAALLRAMSVAPLFKSLSFIFVAIMLARQRQTLRVLIQSGVVIINLVTAYLVLNYANLDGAPAVTVMTEFALMVGYGLGAMIAMRSKQIVI
jgi:O-antigen/teichoic acid export membrane protein